MKKSSLIPLLPAGLLLATLFFSHSCANTTSAPSGGPKDTIPPQLIAVSPLPGSLNVPVHGTKIYLQFDEYVKVKDGKSLFLSPPQEKPLKYRVQGKGVLITFEEDLLPNTTYNLDVTGAIVDNNEGNPFAGYVLTFSTGERIDSMYVTGLVQDSKTLNPVKGATVMLYKDPADSAVFLHRPDAAAKTDEWGFFCIRNIQDTVFRLYAVKDENSNNKYDPETEQVAFADSSITPVNRVEEGIYELYKFDMKDTSACMKRKTDYELNLFKCRPSKQMIVNKVRQSERCAYITFMAPDADIKKLSFKDIPGKKIISMFNQERDSLVMWINDARRQPDTLSLTVDYMKTDSTGLLVRTKEVVKLAQPKDKKQPAKSYRKDIKHEDTIAVYKTVSSPETFEQYGIEINFDYPLVLESFANMKYEVTNPRQVTEKASYILERDSIDVRKVRIRHDGPIMPGYEYKLTVPERGFKDINGFYNDSTVVKMKLPDDEKLSTILLNVSGVNGNRYIIDLMNEKRANVIRSYIIDEDKALQFPYLKAGKYCLRFIEDKNRNNMVDTGDLLAHRQPEMVKFYKLPDGTFLIDIPASSEITQDVNLADMFK